MNRPLDIPPSARETPGLHEARRLVAGVIAVPDLDVLIAGQIQLTAGDLDALSTPLPPLPLPALSPSSDVLTDLTAAADLVEQEAGKAPAPRWAVPYALIARQLRQARDEINGARS